MDECTRRDVELAVRILRKEGAREVYVFGSAAEGDLRPGSDIDLAVRGLPPERFFPAMGEVGFAVSRPIDLVDLDSSADFADFLSHEGKLRRVG